MSNALDEAAPGLALSQTPAAQSASPSGNEPLRLEGVTKRFYQGESPVEALSRLSMSIHAGEFVAIMGASGSGKSTLLHVAAGLTQPNEGRVLIDGTDLAVLSDQKLTQFRRRRIGLIFQAFNLIPALTAEENILLPLVTDGRDRAAEDLLPILLEQLGIAARRRHRPDAMSGGEQQRVAIARALITNPALILADEPTGSLDSITGQTICRCLRDLCQEQRRTIVVVTHEPAVARWAQRVVVMKDGRLLTEFATADFSDAQTLAAHYQEVVNAPAQ